MIYELLFENSVQPSQKLVSATKPLSHGGKTSAHGPECMQTIAMCTAPKKVPFNKGLKIRLLEELVMILSIPVEQVICDNWWSTGAGESPADDIHGEGALASE